MTLAPVTPAGRAAYRVARDIPKKPTKVNLSLPTRAARKRKALLRKIAQNVHHGGPTAVKPEEKTMLDEAVMDPCECWKNEEQSEDDDAPTPPCFHCPVHDEPIVWPSLEFM